MLRPIISALLRHKVIASLIVIEMAFTCAIVCNLIFLIGHQFARLQRDSGLPEDELVFVQVPPPQGTEAAWPATERDLRTIRAVTGVMSATSVNQVIYAGSSWNTSVAIDPDQVRANLNASVYMTDAAGLEAMGLRLVSGRWFEPEEYVPWDSFERVGTTATTVIVSTAMAKALFGTDAAVGRAIYSWGSQPITIIGVVERLVKPNEGKADGIEREHALLLPVHVPLGRYLVRVNQADRRDIVHEVEVSLKADEPSRSVQAIPLADMREEYYLRDWSLTKLLVALLGVLLVAAAAGLTGLLSFWIEQRNAQTGIRRALGATQQQVLNHYQLENFVLSGAGVTIGALLACGLSTALARYFNVPPLPIAYVGGGVAALLLLGQIAVLGPALRAARADPVVMTRMS